MTLNTEKVSYLHPLSAGGLELRVREMIPYEEKEQFA